MRTVMKRGAIVSLGLLLIGIFLLSSCINQLVKVNLGQVFELSIDQTASIASENLSITFLNVLEDSRCPSDVVCVWAGNARVEIEVFKAGEDKVIATLNSFLEPKEYLYQTYLISFKDLAPYPRSTEEIEPQDYRLSLMVAKMP